MKKSLTLPAGSELPLAIWSEGGRFSVLVMEWLWLANWYDLLVQPTVSGALLFLILGTILLLTHILARVMNHLQVRLRWRRVVFIGWVVLVLLLSLRGMIYNGLDLSLIELILRPVRSIGAITDDLREFWHILMLLILIWRAVSLARDEVGILSTQFSFQFGLVMMLFSGIGIGFQKPLQAVLTLYAFLFCSLIAMSAARIYTLGDLRGGKLPLPGRKWALGIGLSALVIVGCAVFAGWASSTWAAEVVLQGYLLLFSLLIVIGLILLSPIIALLFWFSPTLRELLSSLLKGTFLSGLMDFLNGAANAIQNPPEWLVTGLQVGKPLLLGGILLLVLMGLLLLLVWKPWQLRGTREEGSSDLPIHPIFPLPRFILNRLGKRFTDGRRLLAAARIRWVYAQLMKLCAALGQPRPVALTPVEFFPRLLKLFPDHASELRQITDGYLKVRYGMYPETQVEIDIVMACWKRVKQTGNPLVAEYKRGLRKGILH